MRAETIYKGATRPAMKFGVPLVPLVVLFGTGMLLVMWLGVYGSGWAALAVVACLVPTFFWMRWATFQDDQRLRQQVLALKLRLPHRNTGFWRSRSYAPALYRGNRDAWIR